MNRLFCWLTGGHGYADKNLETQYNPFTHQSLMVNRCVKCGKIYTATIDTGEIIKRDLERFHKWHGSYLKSLMNTNSHLSYVRKDGADNG
jgi:hypothetical protein